MLAGRATYMQSRVLTPKWRTIQPGRLQQLRVWIKRTVRPDGKHVEHSASGGGGGGGMSEGDGGGEKHNLASGLLKGGRCAEATVFGPGDRHGERPPQAFRRGKDTKRVSMSKACTFLGISALRFLPNLLFPPHCSSSPGLCLSFALLPCLIPTPSPAASGCALRQMHPLLRAAMETQLRAPPTQTNIPPSAAIA